MSEVDVILSCFATPPKESERLIAQPTHGFGRKVVVLTVDPVMKSGEILASAGFARAAKQYRDQSTGSILRPLLSQRMKGYDVRSVSLVGFSAGNRFLYEVLKGPDIDYVDSVIALDGMIAQKLWDGSIHLPSVRPWADFATKAARDERMFICSFTDIVSHSKQVTSTAEAAAFVQFAASEATYHERLKFPQYDMAKLTAGPPPPPVTISVPRGDKIVEKTWESMPKPAITPTGNFWLLDYGGNAEPDHVFQAVYVQGAIWRTFLTQRINDGIRCRLPDAVSGLGAESCVPNKVTVPKGVYPTESSAVGLSAAAAGLALGTAIGYWAGNRIGR